MPKDQRKAWDADKMGYGKHTYTHVDPDAINVEDFAVDLRGEQQHRGDVREENTAYNEREPDNKVTLDLLSKIGTVFSTGAQGLSGRWKVTGMPVVHSPEVFCRATQIGEDGVLLGEEQELSCTELGCAVDRDNKFKQVQGQILEKGKHQNLG